ncbi:uncharacterized protein L969DRAFT_46224 [Mixia osmundae IAM 14324]|uniref:Uncharacterized protein n=1 Tax=Mixia osmundae (strain CBS 9802 / IAM 14324 / JCM 22182 / KY 12970) TaxID=764103 RepID=G7E5Q1_MIXOS|nr:uncharacterized protein L969DRAFT_46224 [Mixia osmundae IAM 14324]KEI40689.1 hypothetical protein L969DRAFT_46224 [Mixia osmundae IAM 14324]GAA98161.1 hypothetical protein E5Q_04844 [Mixia osmundae IAM 14324]
MAATTVTSQGAFMLNDQMYPFSVQSWSPEQLFELRIQLPKTNKAYCSAFGDAPKGPICKAEGLKTISEHQVLQVNAVRSLQTLAIDSDNESVDAIVRQCCSAFYSFTSQGWVTARKLKLGEAVYTFNCAAGKRPIPEAPFQCQDIFDHQEVYETHSTVANQDARVPIWTLGVHHGCSHVPVEDGSASQQ